MKKTGKGAACLFTNSIVQYTYKVKNKTTKNIKAFGNANVEITEDDILIKIDNKPKEATIVFFS